MHWPVDTDRVCALTSIEVTTHPSPEIPQALVDKIVARRGRLHAFESLEPSRTSLVVIDVSEASRAREPERVGTVIKRINAVAAAVRERGGVVSFVTSEIGDAEGFSARMGSTLAASYVEESKPGGAGRRLAEGLDVGGDDLLAVKRGASAFFPGACALHDRLQARGVEALLIAGLVTNICCESSARDAVELGYRVTMVSDANDGHDYGLHEASLATFFRFFGDVRPTEDVLRLLGGQ